MDGNCHNLSPALGFLCTPGQDLGPAYPALITTLQVARRAVLYSVDPKSSDSQALPVLVRRGVLATADHEKGGMSRPP